MSRDVLITPSSGTVDFNVSGNNRARIEFNAANNLVFSVSNGELVLGNTATNIYVGDGINSVDIIYEQSGAIRALAGKTLTIGQANSNVVVSSNTTFRSSTSWSNGSNTITATMYDYGTLSFGGSAGQLFSITNDLTGSIFSVNDVSGIPSIDVQASGLVSIAPYGGNVGIGRTTADYRLDVNGSVNAAAVLVNGTDVASTGKAIAMAIVFGG